MKSKKRLLILIACMLTLALILSACNLNPALVPDNDGGFVNPGDKLGGGGTGEVPDAVDSSNSDAVKREIQAKSDLSDLQENTSSDGAEVVQASSGIVNISKSGTYLFKGEYGGIYIADKKLDLHFIFDGVTITRENGVAIDGTDYKNTVLVITLKQGSLNTVTNSGTNTKGEAINAIHIKGSLSFNGTGTLNVISESKSALKASKEIKIVDCTLNLTAENHALTGASVIAANCTVNVVAGKDGINAECDEATEFRTSDGFVSLTEVNYTCSVYGDGIQADTVVYINGGSYSIKTTGSFVVKSAANMQNYGMTADDFRYKKSGDNYYKVASDEASGTLYGLTQGCKGIKVGEIEYTDDDGNDVVVTEGDYLIVIVGGTFNIDSTDDAIHTNSGDVMIEGGSFTISTNDDGITAGVLTKITGGDITITTCYEGIEGGYVEISGGTINLVSTDDGINASSDNKNVTPHIIISGGNITVNASGDGIDSNGSILISGGTVTVHGPTSGRDAGLDADKGIVVTGGTLFVASTLQMVETPSTNSTQYVVSYAHQSTITAGSTVSLCDASGKALVSVQVLKNCQSIIISCSAMKKGETYYIYGGETQMASFTISSIITNVGSSGSTFPGGGGPGGPGGRPGNGPGGR
ncbi:MAG: carbohydrate-binding domain-containing protein [Clostridiales bacterium]|nr:carbohydrate-binding domain-containing protein [Clostridiales bacterium]